jgi:hypothetical protein
MIVYYLHIICAIALGGFCADESCLVESWII